VIGVQYSIHHYTFVEYLLRTTANISLRYKPEGFPMYSLRFFIDLILPDVVWFCGLLST
jgi:hypothetical protein